MANTSVSIWAIANAGFCVNLIVADEAHVNMLKLKKPFQFQDIVSATDMLPDYTVKIGDIYNPKTKTFTHPS